MTPFCFLLVLALNERATSADFTHDILPLLTRAGCSAADCHGGAKGRGGFKLSLMGTHPRADFASITEELFSRRVDWIQPKRSLILEKPSQGLRHGGGMRLDPDGMAYKAIESWITGGAPWKRGPEKRLSDLKVSVATNRLQVSAFFQFNDDEKAERRDVTSMATFASSDDRVVRVDSHGHVQRIGPGRAWLIARYRNRGARVEILYPFDAPSHNETVDDDSIDSLWLSSLGQIGLKPSPRASFDTLIRRLYLILTGRPPTSLQRRDALAASYEDRLRTVADHILESDAFESRLASWLEEWLEIPWPHREERHQRERHATLRRWIRGEVENSEGLHHLVRAMFDKTKGRGLLERFSDPRDRAEFVGRSLLGMSVGCARCHDHPTDRLTQRDHLAFSAHFAALSGDGSPGMSESSKGRFFSPLTGEAIDPSFLRLGASDASTTDLVSWLVDGGHQAFSRNIANRLFDKLMGTPLVSPLDDHRLSNPAIDERLLDALATRLRAYDYQLRPLIRDIVTSRLWAQSTQSDPGHPDRIRYLAQRDARTLTPMEAREAIAAVLGVPATTTPPPSDPLAFQLERLNGPLIAEALAIPGNQVDIISAFTPPDHRVRELFLTILSREPTPDETAAFEALGSDKQSLEDLAFALLCSREFGSVR